MATTKKTTPKKTSAPKTPKVAPAAKASKLGKPKFGFKSAFIKSQPVTMTAKEVVAAAKVKGITLSENLVYAARAASKSNGGAAAGKKAAGPKTKAKPGPKPKAKGSSSNTGSLEATLRNAIAELGLAKARAVFEAVEKAFKG